MKSLRKPQGTLRLNVNKNQTNQLIQKKKKWKKKKRELRDFKKFSCFDFERKPKNMETRT